MLFLQVDCKLRSFLFVMEAQNVYPSYYWKFKKVPSAGREALRYLKTSYINRNNHSTLAVSVTVQIQVHSSQGNLAK